MFFQQFKVEGLGCLSYMIGCPLAGTAVVIDPQRDIAEYLACARQNSLTISGIIDTHVHADHISGSHELRARTNAPIHMFAGSGVDYPHVALEPGQQISIGPVRFEVVHTPGHTPFAITLAVTDTARSNEPEMLLTGDLLFVGSIGRPDLAGGELRDQQIANLYHSLHATLGRFADSVEIYPAHGEGSLCGSGLSAKPSSTLGFERTSNPFFKRSFDEFTAELTRTTPIRPKNFTHIIQTNKQGARLVADLPVPQRMGPEQIKLAGADGALLIDLREASSFGGAHIPGSINIGFTPQSANWLGTVVEPGTPLVLLAHSDAAIEAAIVHFRRAGYDHIAGFCVGLNAWISSGEEIAALPQRSIHRLKQLLEEKPDHPVIDVRSPAEWQAGHIPGAIHVPLNRFVDQGIDISPDQPVSVVCGTGYRSNIAASLLLRQGYTDVDSMIGGMRTWMVRYPTVTETIRETP